MYYKFNNISGQVIGTSNVQTPLYPITPAVYSKVEAPTVRYANSPKLCTVSPIMRAPGSKGYGTKAPEHIRRMQELFQKSNDLPVHLKGGPADKMLFLATCGLLGLGIIGMADLFWTLAWPRKQ